MAGNGPRQSIDPRQSMNALRQESKVHQRLTEEVHKLKSELTESEASYKFAAEQIESARRANLSEAQRAGLLAQTIAAANQEWAKVQAVRDQLKVANYDLDDFRNIISDTHTGDLEKNAATLAWEPR